MPGYPIVLDLTDRLVVVVGLGAVGRRKAAGLAEAGASVRGVDPRGVGGPIGGNVSVLAEPYREQHLDGACLAFAAATPEVNRHVVADARRRGLLANSASEPASGDFAVPSVWRSGPIVLGVSTSGGGPAFSALLRDRAAEAIGPEAAGYAAMLAELRPSVLDRLPDEQARRALLRAWSDRRWLDRFASAGPEATRAELLAMLDRLAPGDDPRPDPA